MENNLPKNEGLAIKYYAHVHILTHAGKKSDVQALEKLN